MHPSNLGNARKNLHPRQRPWSLRETLCLHSLYHSNKEKSGLRNFVSAEHHLWAQIIDEFNKKCQTNRANSECIEHLKDMVNLDEGFVAKRRKLNSEDSSSTTPSVSEDNHAQIRATMKDIRLRCKADSSMTAVVKTLQDTMLFLHNIREVKQERRHRELMESLERLAERHENSANPIDINVDQNCESVGDVRQTLERLGDMGMGEDEGALQDCLEDLPQDDLSQDDPQQDDLESLDEEERYSVFVDSASDEVAEPAAEATEAVYSVQAKEPQDEFAIMREKMLEMQRRKMEDRERKKRESQRNDLI